jgi:hypothetical protein
MLTEQEIYLARKNMVFTMMDVRKRAKNGKDYQQQLCRAVNIRIGLEVCDNTVATVVQSGRIFDGIFE